MAFFYTVPEADIGFPAAWGYRDGIYRGDVPFGQVTWTDDKHLASIGDKTKWIPLGAGAVRGDYASIGLFHMLDIRVISEIRLRIRNPGNANGDVVGYVPPGTILTVVDTDAIRKAIGDGDAWIHMGYDGVEGWINGKYVALVAKPEPPGDSVTMEYHLSIVADFQTRMAEYEAELEKYAGVIAGLERYRQMVRDVWALLAGAGPVA
jgi:hypothetical protein